jgi:hypothetical protein
MRRRARRVIAAGAVFAAAAVVPGPAWAGAGGSPAAQANCVGMANAGGANGAFLRSIEPGSNARDFGTAGGAGLPASQNDCSLP